ncbi:hypothetical protein C8R46DRAFT_1246131 [Mycena filopes]|nr:hypothetical protein C8R46DRAFT_1246131 [Mycena filopes]
MDKTFLSSGHRHLASSFLLTTDLETLSGTSGAQSPSLLASLSCHPPQNESIRQTMSLFEYRPPQATIRHRLRYNILPTDEERKSIADSVSIARDRLVAIRTELASAHDASEDKALSAYISEYSSLVAPIRRLNDDVLALVFPVALRSDLVVRLPLQEDSVHRHPMTLTSISHYWRCVAMQTPEIWSTISVSCWRSPRGYLRECLRNSKDHRLSLHLDLSLRPPNMDIMNELIMHAERWVALKLNVKDTEHLHSLDSVRGRLCRLRQIAFRFDSISSPPQVMFHGFVIAPQLRSIQVHLLRRLRCIPPLPFHQITKVAFVNSDRTAVWKALQLFINASRVDLSESLDGQFHGPLAPAAPDPHLNVVVIELRIRDDGSTERGSMAMLDTLTIPNLERLHLVDCLVWQGPSILPFVTRSGCSLRELVLQDTRARVGELLALLRLTPTLETLVLTQLLPNCITDALIGPLTPATNNANLLLPVLERVTIAGTYLFGTTALLNMLERRSPRLVNVNIVLADREIGAPDRARFAALRTALTKISRLVCLDETRSLVGVN